MDLSSDEMIVQIVSISENNTVEINKLQSLPPTHFILFGIEDTGLSFSTGLHSEENVQKSLNEVIKYKFAKNIIIPNASLNSNEKYKTVNLEQNCKIIAIVDDFTLTYDNDLINHIKSFGGFRKIQIG